MMENLECFNNKLVDKFLTEGDRLEGGRTIFHLLFFNDDSDSSFGL